MAVTIRKSADLKLYFFGETVGNFMAGKRGVNIEVTRDMVDVTSQLTTTTPLVKVYQPGLQGAKMEFDGLYVIPDAHAANLSIPQYAAEVLRTLRSGTRIKALINIFPGTAGASYLDSETITMYGYLSNVKFSAGSLADGATFSATFTIDSDVAIVNGEGDPIYTP